MGNRPAGFFSKEQLQELEQVECVKCGLYKTCQSPNMKPTGKGKKKILVVAEAPGKKEDEDNEQLVGPAGQVLRRVLEEHEIDLDNDCWKTNSVVCRPPKNRTPSKKELKACRINLLKTINKKKPHLILLLGGAALDSFLMGKIAGGSGGINKWRGFIPPDQTFKAWVAPMFHPSFVLWSQGEVVIEKLFELDIKNALKKVVKKVPEYVNEINVITNPSEYGEVLEQLTLIKEQKSLVAFDYETTGLKSYGKGHEIVCCAVHHEGHTISFPMDDKRIVELWKEILKDRSIPKTAHNMKFEHQWSRNILGVRVKGWIWDSLLAAHIIDNRGGITGLKFQAYAQFGQEDYSSYLDKYLKSKGEFNNIKQVPMDKLLYYCGMDALLQFRLAKKQMRILNGR